MTHTFSGLYYCTEVVVLRPRVKANVTLFTLFKCCCFPVAGCLGCFEWSASEEKILYVAEKKYKKAVSYFAKRPKDDEKKDDVERVSDFF